MTVPLPGREPVPLTPPSEPIAGHSHQHLIAPLLTHAAELGYHVKIRELPEHGPAGWCDPTHHRITVAAGPPNRQVRILVHELAHAHGLDYQHYSRERCEVLVDCATYCVLGSVGLDISGETIPYIAGWGGRRTRGHPRIRRDHRQHRAPDRIRTRIRARRGRRRTRHRSRGGVAGRGCTPG